MNVVTPPLPGTPPSAWYPIIPCLEPHLLSGTPSPCLEPHPMSGTPSFVWNPITMSGPHSCLEPHPSSDIKLPSAPDPPFCPYCTYPIWSLIPQSAPTHLIWPQAAPHLELYTRAPSSCPHPIKYHHQRSPPPEKKIWVFPCFLMFVSISPHINLTLHSNIFDHTS